MITIWGVRMNGIVLAATLGSLTLLIAFVILTAPAPPAPALSTRSAEPDGALALRLWLEKSGYTVREVRSKPIRPESINALFILDPLAPYDQQEAETIRTWVASGGTLIAAGSPPLLQALLKPYNVSLTYLPESAPLLLPASPALGAPPVSGVRAEAIYGIEGARPDLVIHLAAGGVPVLASFGEGQGAIWLSGAMRPFTNRGLSDLASSRLILNMLAGLPQKAVIGFDEARHGFGETRTISGWLVGSAPGWGVLLAVALTMTYLALHGRRFGRAVPLPAERLRREPVEYIQAMAALYRRSGQRAEILGHYRDQLRRRLSERYALDPKLDDVELVKTMAFRDPALDEAALRDLLKQLRNPHVSEAELMGAALAVDEWLRKIT